MTTLTTCEAGLQPATRRSEALFAIERERFVATSEAGPSVVSVSREYRLDEVDTVDLQRWADDGGGCC